MFWTYTPLSLESPGNKSAVMMAFVNQAVPDVKHKLQRIDRMQEKSLQEMMTVTEKVFNNLETPAARQAHANAKQTCLVTESEAEKHWKFQQLEGDKCKKFSIEDMPQHQKTNHHTAKR